MVDFRKLMLGLVAVVLLATCGGHSSPVNRTVGRLADKRQVSRNLSVLASDEDSNTVTGVRLKTAKPRKSRKPGVIARTAPVLGVTFPQTLRPERQTNSTTVNEFRSAILILVVFIISVLVILSYKLILFNRSN